MKVIYLHQHFSTPQGSTGTRSYSFARALVDKGHRVTMICGNYWVGKTGLKGDFKRGMRSGFVDGGIYVIELELDYSNSDNFIRRSKTFFRYMLKAIKLVLTLEYDILFATSTPLTAGIPGLFARLIKNKPFIFEVRDLWPELPKAMGVIKNPLVLFSLDILETVIYKSSSACIGLSPGIVEGIKKKTPNKLVRMIPNGCDLNLIELNKKNKKSNNFIAAFCGAHGYANGLDSILDTARLLIDNDIDNINFHFIGDGALKKILINRKK